MPPSLLVLADSSYGPDGGSNHRQPGRKRTMAPLMWARRGRRPLRIVHLSDIHFWRYEFHPLRLASKRLFGMLSLVLRRARRFRLERVPELVEYVRSLDPDHILITGDVTTTALPAEFQAARAALTRWLDDPVRVTIVPGNHDRYTLRAHRSRRLNITSATFLRGCHTRGFGDSISRRRSWGSTQPVRPSRRGKTSRSPDHPRPRIARGLPRNLETVDRLPLSGGSPVRVSARVCTKADGQCD